MKRNIRRIAPWAALAAVAAVVAASFAAGWSLTGEATAQNTQQRLRWYCFAQTEDGVTFYTRIGRADTRAAAESTFRLVATTEATSQGKKLATLSCGSEWPDRADELYASASAVTALTAALEASTGDVAALTARVAALEASAGDATALTARVAALEASAGDATALTARVAALEAAPGGGTESASDIAALTDRVDSLEATINAPYGGHQWLWDYAVWGVALSDKQYANNLERLNVIAHAAGIPRGSDEWDAAYAAYRASR